MRTTSGDISYFDRVMKLYFPQRNRTDFKLSHAPCPNENEAYCWKWSWHGFNKLFFFFLNSKGTHCTKGSGQYPSIASIPPSIPLSSIHPSIHSFLKLSHKPAGNQARRSFILHPVCLCGDFSKTWTEWKSWSARKEKSLSLWKKRWRKCWGSLCWSSQT